VGIERHREQFAYSNLLLWDALYQQGVRRRVSLQGTQ